MTRLLTDSREFYALVFTVPFVLLGITVVDFIITVNVIHVPLQEPTLSMYWSVLALITLVMAVPILGIVWFLKNEISTFIVWAVALLVPLASGSEDLIYYGIWKTQFSGTWATFPWLDSTVSGLSRILTQTSNVTFLGLVISALLGWVVVAITVYVYFEVLE